MIGFNFVSTSRWKPVCTMREAKRVAGSQVSQKRAELRYASTISMARLSMVLSGVLVHHRAIYGRSTEAHEKTNQFARK